MLEAWVDGLRIGLPEPAKPAFDSMVSMLDQLALEGRLSPAELPGALERFASILGEYHRASLQ